MDTVHNAIAWYQTKIGSYDKQLWEQSVEKKLQKLPPNVHSAPKKSVRLKTEYIDVDLIRGSTFTKTKPQVPWVYVTRKAIARVLFFPFYYTWWVHQTSIKLYSLLVVLYVMQVITVAVYLRNYDQSITEDEMSFTEVILPGILMFLLCLIHSQTVLAYITHKPPKRTKSMSGLVFKPKPKKSSRKSSKVPAGTSSACPDDNTVTDRLSRSKNGPGTSQEAGSSRDTKRCAGASKSSRGMSNGLKDKAKKERVPAGSQSDTRNKSSNIEVRDYKRSPQAKQFSGPTEESLVHSCDPILQRKLPHVPENGGVESFCVENKAEAPGANLQALSTCHPSSVPTWHCGCDLLGNLACLASHNQSFSFNDSKGTRAASVSNANSSVQVVSHNKCPDHYQPHPCPNHHSLPDPDFCPQGEIVQCVDQAPQPAPIPTICCHPPSSHFKKTSENSQQLKMNSETVSPVPDIIQTFEGHACICDSTTIGKATSGKSSLPSFAADSESHSQSEWRPNGYEDIAAELGEMANLSRHEAQEPSQGSPIPESPCPPSCHPVSPLTAQVPPCSLDMGVANVTVLQQGLSKQDHSQAVSQTPELSSPDSGCVDPSRCASSSFSPCPHRTTGLPSSHDNSCGMCQEMGWQDGRELPVLDCVSRQGESTSRKDGSGHCQRCSSQSSTTSKARDVFTENDTIVADSSESTPVRSYSQGGSDSECVLTAVENSPVSSAMPSFSQTKNLEGRASPPGFEDEPDLPTPNSAHLQCFSELFIQEILNENTLREISSYSQMGSSDRELENSSSSVGRLSTASMSSSLSTSRMNLIGLSRSDADSTASSTFSSKTSRKNFRERLLHSRHANEVNQLDESLDQTNTSDCDRASDASNYNASDSDPDSDVVAAEELRGRYEEKFSKHVRLQEVESVVAVGSIPPRNCPGAIKLSTSASNGIVSNGVRSVPNVFIRKRSPMKDLANIRMPTASAGTGHSSGSDIADSEARNSVRRRRRLSGNPVENGDPARSRTLPKGLELSSNKRHLSSSENEGGAQTPEGHNKATVSSEEWDDHMQTDETTSVAYTTSCGTSDSEVNDNTEERTEYTTSTLHVINLLQPQAGSPTSSGHVTQPDKVSCVIWELNECKKVDLSALEIGYTIIDRVDRLHESSDYFLIGLLFSVVMGLVPLVFRAYVNKDLAKLDDFLTWQGIVGKLAELPYLIDIYSWRQYLLMINGISQRFFLSLLFFFLLAVAERTFKQRLLYAKHFSYLTSSRRARKFSMPHFRLNKVRNIKIWLSLRSYLKRRGPQRSVDVIVSASFLCGIIIVCFISLQMLKETDNYLGYLCNWELLVWCLALGIFLMRFMTLGLKINKKYRNLSVLITEQINLYLQMEQKPHKKEELILANNVLRLAEGLLKELESPFKISGFSANPLIYNITKVVVLSAFSAVLTEVLGFKLKLHKIKLKG